MGNKNGVARKTLIKLCFLVNQKELKYVSSIFNGPTIFVLNCSVRWSSLVYLKLRVQLRSII